MSVIRCEFIALVYKKEALKLKALEASAFYALGEAV